MFGMKAKITIIFKLVVESICLLFDDLILSL